MTTALLHAESAFDGERRITDAVVVIENGRIAWFGPKGLAPRDAAAEEWEVRRDLTLLPGFVNCHVHLTLSSQVSGDGDIAATDATQALRAHANALRALKAGVTTQRDLGAPSGVVIDLARGISNREVLGPTVVPAGRAITTTRGPGWPLNLGVRGLDEIRSAVRRQAALGAEVIKIISGERLLGPAHASPDDAQFTPEEMRAAVDEAHRFGLPITAHAHATEGIRIAVEAGVDSIEHATHIDRTLIELCKQRDIGLIPTFSMLDAIVRNAASLDPSVVEEARALIPDQRKVIYDAYKAGVRLGTGTDAGSRFNFGDDYAREVEIFVEIGISVLDALRSATSGSADILGLSDVGRLRPGARADMVAVRGNPFENLQALRHVVAVWKDGRFIPAIEAGSRRAAQSMLGIAYRQAKAVPGTTGR